MSQAAGPVASDAAVLDFSILGRRFQARGVSAAVAEWLRSNWHFPEHDGHEMESAYGIVFEVKDQAPVRVGGDGVGAGERGERDGGETSAGVEGADDAAAAIAPGWRGRDAVWTSGTQSAGVQLSLGRESARIHGWGLDDRAAQAELSAAVHVAMCEALRASGLLPLHASVAARDGNASAFLARSGTGKSTTLLHAIRAGWAPIAEDFAWVDPETRAVYGWDRGIRLWPEGRASVEAGAGAGDGERPGVADSWRLGTDGKLFLDYAAIAARSPRRAVLTELVLLVRDGTGVAGWEPLRPRDAVRAMWEATGVPLAPASRAWVAREIAGVLGRVGARRLRLGTGPPSRWGQVLNQ